MKRYLAIILLLASCQVAEPTYIDIPEDTMQLIAGQLHKSVSDALFSSRETLRDQLSKELGMTVTRIIEEDKSHEADVLAAANEARVEVAAVRKIVAEIEPATTAAFRSFLDKAGEDPTKATNWINAGLVAGGIIGAGFLGLRGRRKRSNDDAKAA